MTSGNGAVAPRTLQMGECMTKRRRCDADLPLPVTVASLIENGGPLAYVRNAAKRAAREEARFWLDLLEKVEPGDNWQLETLVVAWVKAVKRILCVNPTADEIRVQTRERVRRWREARRSPPRGE
jgi:hypothetical protein